jgi:hypothetical protein
MPSISTMTVSTPVRRNAGEQQHQAARDRLDEGDTEHAERHGANGRGAQLGQFGAAPAAGQAHEDRRHGASARPAEGHDDPGDDERDEEQQRRSAEARHTASALSDRSAIVRLQALQERRQIGMGSRPEVMDLRRRTAIRRRSAGRRNLQRVVAHADGEVMDRIAQQGHQEGRRRHDQDDACQHQERGRQPCLPPMRRASF